VIWESILQHYRERVWGYGRYGGKRDAVNGEAVEIPRGYRPCPV